MALDGFIGAGDVGDVRIEDIFGANSGPMGLNTYAGGRGSGGSVEEDSNGCANNGAMGAAPGIRVGSYRRVRKSERDAVVLEVTGRLMYE